MEPGNRGNHGKDRIRSPHAYPLTPHAYPLTPHMYTHALKSYHTSHTHTFTHLHSTHLHPTDSSTLHTITHALLWIPYHTPTHTLHTIHTLHTLHTIYHTHTHTHTTTHPNCFLIASAAGSSYLRATQGMPFSLMYLAMSSLELGEVAAAWCKHFY